MLNRRQILVGTAATAAVVACPSIIQAAVPVKDDVLDHVIKMISDHHDGCRYYSAGPMEDMALDIDLNTRLLTKYPSLFPRERHLFSGCPGNLFYSDIRNDRMSACVRSRKLWPEYTMELAQDLKTIDNHGGSSGDRAYDSFIDMIVDELAVDIRAEQIRLGTLARHMSSNNAHMFSLIPVLAYRFVDANSYQASFAFKSRYAVVEADYRILSAEEDQKIEKRKWNQYPKLA